MAEGFFPKSTMLTKAPPSLVAKCGACGLYKSCKSPKMVVSGEGKRKILVVGEAPGKDEDDKGKQFVGKSGQLLEQCFRKFGVNLRRDCWLTNAVICRPPDNKLRPNEPEIDWCRPNLIKTIQELKPEIILPFGGPAVESLVGWLWKDKVGAIGRWVGWQIPSQRLNSWVCPNWHPAALLYADNQNKNKGKVQRILFERYLSLALELEGRPWESVPNYKKDVTIILDEKEAAKRIRKYNKRATEDDVAAFDYETNMLKPEWPEADILCASICWNGRETISYLWHGEAIEASKEFLRNPCKKIASNLKFEQRWTIKFLRTPVKNWWWDTMLAAHVYDNRQEITGLKFQSFVWLGVEEYDSHIKELLQSKGDNRANQARREIDTNQLLLYCGLDSLLEYHVCRKQRKAMGFE